MSDTIISRLLTLVFFMILTGVVYKGYTYFTFDYHLQYYANVPTKFVFTDEEIKHFSFAETRSPLEITFYNRLMCRTDSEQAFTPEEPRLFVAPGFEFYHPLPNNETLEAVDPGVLLPADIWRLQKYAFSNAYTTWSLKEIVPTETKQCYDLGRITIKTPFLGIPLSKEVPGGLFWYIVEDPTVPVPR